MNSNNPSRFNWGLLFLIVAGILSLWGTTKFLYNDIGPGTEMHAYYFDGTNIKVTPHSNMTDQVDITCTIWCNKEIINNRPSITCATSKLQHVKDSLILDGERLIKFMREINKK